MRPDDAASADLLTELELEQELDRLRAQESFLAYYQRMTAYEPPRHVKVVAKFLQAMEDDKIDRGMLFMPPRHAKTTLASDLFPSWQLGKYESVSIMCVSHTGTYAEQIGMSVRNRFWQPEWPFERALADDSQAKARFRTNAGGRFNGFGMQTGSQHGNPADWLIMDDIVGGQQIALSSHMRDQIWESYLTNLRTRLQGRRKQLMVYTRWHMDDPAGRILPEGFDGRTGWYRDRETGEPWYVLSLPAVAEHDSDPLGRQRGEWLWPEQHGEAQLGSERKRGGWRWSALYQQRPAPEDGMMFTPEHFMRFDPRGINRNAMRFYVASDYATKDQKDRPDPDWTVHLVWAVDPDWNIYLVDGWRGRTLSDRWVAEWLRLVRKWKPLMAAEESGQINASVGPFLNRMMQQERVFVARQQLVSSVDKVQRAQSLLGMAAMGKMFLPDRAKCERHMLDLLDAFETELLQFPTGRHDDSVDAATLFARMLDRISSGEQPRKRRSPHGYSMDDLWSDHDALSRTD